MDRSGGSDGERDPNPPSPADVGETYQADPAQPHGLDTMTGREPHRPAGPEESVRQNHGNCWMPHRVGTLQGSESRF